MLKVDVSSQTKSLSRRNKSTEIKKYRNNDNNQLLLLSELNR